MPEERPGTIERLSGLLRVTRLVNTGVQGEDLRSAVAATVSEAFGYRTVIINLRRPDSEEFEVATVHGSPDAAEVLLGTTTDLGSWWELLSPTFEVAGAYFVPSGAVNWAATERIAFVAEFEPLAARNAWQPEDALFVPLWHSGGDLLGVVSVDEPADGLRPGADDLAVLTSLTAHLAQALETADANRAQERLHAQVRDGERRYRKLVESLPAIVYRAEFGDAARWEYISPQVEAVLGYTVEEWRAGVDLWRERLHPDDREAALAADEAAKRSGDPLDCEYRMLAKDGRTVWIRDEAVVLDESSGPLLQGVMYDVTVQKLAEEAIRDHNMTLERTVRERTSELEDARVETLQRLAFAAEYRDEETYLHTERVGRAAALLAEAVGLPATRVELIRRAAPLHDIGKVAVPDQILRKPGRLDGAERGLMCAHTTIGGKILSGSRSAVLRLAEEIALTHHERWDGTGYPRGLSGEEIPLSGRLVAIADTYDALTHTRPYKEAWSAAEALAEIRRGAGTQFDPELVDAFAGLDRAVIVRAS